jgi:hypothetical protein
MADGENQRPLVERRNSLRFRDSAPAWSADGKLIAAAATTAARAYGPKVAVLLFDAETAPKSEALDDHGSTSTASPGRPRVPCSLRRATSRRQARSTTWITLPAAKNAWS